MEQSGYEFENERKAKKENEIKSKFYICLLYTSDAADERYTV